MKKKLFILSLLVSMMFIDSCTDLEEDVLDESLSGGAVEGVEGTISPAYAVLPTLFQHTLYFELQEISTDEAILPYRGGTDWGDNNVHMQIHAHTQTSQNVRVSDVWNQLVSGITRSVSAISALKAIDGTAAKTYLAEARALRAYYSMLTLDLFGIVFKKEELPETSTILRTSEAVDYLESEFLAVVDQLDNTTGPGRITQAAVWGLLARLKLNAAVYRNPYGDSFDFTAEDMDDVIEYCDKIIALNKYSFSLEYFDIFGNDNHDNPELIFAIDQRPDLNGHNRMAYFSLSGDQFPLANFVKANGTDGPGLTPEYYHTWVDAYAPADPATVDPRFYKKNLITPKVQEDTCLTAEEYKIDRGILRGQQYGLITPEKGKPFELCGDGTFKIGKLHNNTRKLPGELVIFTEEIDFDGYDGYNSGYRVEKYEFSRVSDTGRNNGEADIVILRLADIYMMRAEAILRKGGSAEEARTNVNAVRASRTERATPPPALTSMNLDILYRERGFEFYWEMLRRTDMIRFGKYEDTWTEKTDTDKRRRLFPIPQTAIDGASEIPGYLVQNSGY